MKQRLSTIAGFGAGAGLMYFLDPYRGPRRRALIREKGIHYVHKSQSLAGKAQRDARNRAKGMVFKSRSSVLGLGRSKVDDAVLVGRIRSKLGRYVSHPHAIHVLAQNGKIVLSGLILSHELDPLLSRISRMPGVVELESRLDAHERDDHLPSLQGGIPRVGEKYDVLQTNWAPSTRIALGCLGSAVAVSGLRKRGLLSGIFGLTGLVVFLRALTNLETKTILGMIVGKRPIRLHKTMNIDASVEDVFRFLANFENFPRFMKEVKEVRIHRSGRSHWTVRGPAGTLLNWESVITRSIPNQLLAWRSVPGSALQHAGRLTFRTNAQNGTEVNLDFSYYPPAGALGHFTARLLGIAPKNRFDEGMAQMKTLIEEGPSVRQIRGRSA